MTLCCSCAHLAPLQSQKAFHSGRAQSSETACCFLERSRSQRRTCASTPCRSSTSAASRHRFSPRSPREALSRASTPSPPRSSTRHSRLSRSRPGTRPCLQSTWPSSTTSRMKGLRQTTRFASFARVQLPSRQPTARRFLRATGTSQSTARTQCPSRCPSRSRTSASTSCTRKTAALGSHAPRQWPSSTHRRCRPSRQACAVSLPSLDQRCCATTSRIQRPTRRTSSCSRARMGRRLRILTASSSQVTSAFSTPMATSRSRGAPRS
mmetsp:Transcript_4100/g.9178  ORF Transcript_4100/g.9178 Transcript_4100/m.9178 type:complete len:266 (-) Transcript_4100:2413-3210(-)